MDTNYQQVLYKGLEMWGKSGERTSNQPCRGLSLLLGMSALDGHIIMLGANKTASIGCYIMMDMNAWLQS